MLAAGAASFDALRLLATYTGWSGWAAYLLPVSVDVAGVVAVITWLVPAWPARARVFAAKMTLVALAVSALGNMLSQWVTTGMVDVGWPLVALVGAVPAVSMAGTIHLAVLCSGGAAPAVKARPVKTPVAERIPESGIQESEPRTRKLSAVPAVEAPRLDEAFLARLRELDEAHRAEHGRPISQKKARAVLGGRLETIAAALKVVRTAA